MHRTGSFRWNNFEIRINGISTDNLKSCARRNVAENISFKRMDLFYCPQFPPIYLRVGIRTGGGVLLRFMCIADLTRAILLRLLCIKYIFDDLCGRVTFPYINLDWNRPVFVFGARKKVIAFICNHIINKFLRWWNRALHSYTWNALVTETVAI